MKSAKGMAIWISSGGCGYRRDNEQERVTVSGERQCGGVRKSSYAVEFLLLQFNEPNPHYTHYASLNPSYPSLF